MVRGLPGVHSELFYDNFELINVMQEDPFKLVIIAKDVQHRSVISADFLFSSEGQFYIAMGDEEGVVRLLEYEPTGE